MAALKDTTVRRAGVTARYWYQTIRNVGIRADTRIKIGFSMASKGGGDTQVQMEIGPEDFGTLLEAMTIVDRGAAMRAMALELSRQVRLQPERDRQTRLAGMKAVQDAARDKWFAKPSGEDKDEQVVYAGVQQIVQDLTTPTSD